MPVITSEMAAHLLAGVGVSASTVLFHRSCVPMCKALNGAGTCLLYRCRRLLLLLGKEFYQNSNY